MDTLNIRIKHVHGGNARTVDINLGHYPEDTLPALARIASVDDSGLVPADAGEASAALVDAAVALGCECTRDDILHAIDALQLRHVGAWTKVLADGTHVPATDPRTDHVAVIDHAAGLMWAVESLGDPENPGDGISQERCIDRCNTLRLLGHDDWRLPTRTELAGRVDDTRRAPAIDTHLFPRVLPRWHWTSTALVNEDGTASASGAWSVGFYDGYVDLNHRDGSGFALAVRRVGQ